MAYDVDGSLLVCEQVSSCLIRIHADGRRETGRMALRRRVHEQPQRRDRASTDGSIYFTDPDYGRWNDWIGCKREFVRDFKGVYRVPPGGGPAELVVAATSSSSRTGCASRPTRTLLYINDSPRAEIKVYDVAADGSLSNRRCSATTSAAARWGRATSTAWSATSTATSGRRVPGRVGAQSARRADRGDPHAGDLRQRRVRRTPTCDVVPDDDDHGAFDAHQGRSRSAAIAATCSLFTTKGRH